MNRRSFFNFLGSAVIGTVIALKLPDSIAPLNKFISNSGVITYEKLLEAYNRCKNQFGEPSSIIVSRKNYNKLTEFIRPEVKFTEAQIDSCNAEHLTFRNAVIQSPVGIGIQPIADDEIALIPNGWFHAKKYDFV